MEVTADARRRRSAEVLHAARVIGTGGFIETPEPAPRRPATSCRSPTAADLAQVAVRRRDGDAAAPRRRGRGRGGHQPLIGDAVINGGPGLLLIVEKLPWANTLAVTQGVEDALDDAAAGAARRHTSTPTIFRPASFIEVAIHNLTQALLLGCLLVVVILGAFLFEWRVALISLVTIPLSLVATMLVLYWRGATINTMVLAGLVIAVGAVVDDAIIDVENIVRRLRQHRARGSGESTASVILRPRSRCAAPSSTPP